MDVTKNSKKNLLIKEISIGKAMWWKTQIEKKINNYAIENFEFMTFLFLWTYILSSMDNIQKILQTKGISFIQALTLLETLTDKLKVWRNKPVSYTHLRCV